MEDGSGSPRAEKGASQHGEWGAHIQKEEQSGDLTPLGMPWNSSSISTLALKGRTRENRSSPN